ncbi:VRR-NUC domain-containing protein [Fusobacterium animalis]|uniref:VRR-NUC domain-containing protein n=1 Tax=Fusobacterium animalis TaxID=76859 RepID=UPI0034DF0EF6
MKKSEKEIEAYLVRSVKNKKGLCMKWTSPGNAGVPDRIIMIPGGKVYFVELKAEGKRNNLSPLQKNFILKLKNLNCDVKVIASFQEVDEFIEEVMPK